MRHKHRPSRARFWLAGPDDDIESIYPRPLGGWHGWKEEVPQTWQEERARRSISAMTEADWVVAFSRSSNRIPNAFANSKGTLLPPPPRFLDTSRGVDDNEWCEDWADGPLRRPSCKLLLVMLLTGALLGPLLIRGCWPWHAFRGVVRGELGLGRGEAVPALSARPSPAKLDKWIRREADFAFRRVLENIGPTAGVPDGVVIASPSTGGENEPDYFYTWTRDAALTVSSLLPSFLPSAYLEPWDTRWATDAPLTRAHKESHPLLEGLVRSYASAQATLQSRPNPSGDLWTGGLSEPKFGVDLTPLTGSWGRPQRDGPALRALALIPYAHWLLDRGFPADIAYVRETLYDPNSLRRPGSVIKNDLEEVAGSWHRKSFDLWEELKARHLFTDAMSWRAMQAGAGLAARLGDDEAADFYETQASLLGQHLPTYCQEGVWIATEADAQGRRTGLDAAILLASIHAGGRGNSTSTDEGEEEVNLAAGHATVLASVREYVQSFSSVYAVNGLGNWTEGWLVGRYAEDVYDGVGFTGGNPWYLTTLAVAQTLYSAAEEFGRAGAIPLDPRSAAFWADILQPLRPSLSYPDPSYPSKEWVGESGHWEAGRPKFEAAMAALTRTADAFLVRVGRATQRGRMSEQVDRKSGRPRGARDLTWSYAAFLDAARARDRAKKAWKDAREQARREREGFAMRSGRAGPRRSG